MTNFVLWFTGYSGSGKTTLANIICKYLTLHNINSCIIDGDIVRKTISQDLSFLFSDREENTRRIVGMCQILQYNNIVPIVATISPSLKERNNARKALHNFVEIFFDIPFSVAELRDVKGLYKKARHHNLPFFTGIDSVYQRPNNPEIRLDTFLQKKYQCLQTILEYLKQKKYLGEK